MIIDAINTKKITLPTRNSSTAKNSVEKVLGSTCKLTVATVNSPSRACLRANDRTTDRWYSLIASIIRQCLSMSKTESATTLEKPNPIVSAMV